jgi:hypothetical protein
MKAVTVCVMLCAFGVTLHAQKKPAVQLRLSHPLSLNRIERSSVSAYRDTVRVLAIMVDFQSLADTRVSGDGTFMLQANQGMVDPPPHDALFFSYKMQFVQNYFRKVSNGKLTVIGTVLNRILTVSSPMSNYAPETGTNNRALAQFAAESWAIADSVFPGYPFDHYDAFVIFHAGVGHDLNLVNVLGYDPTPLNLPSLYLGPQALKDAFNDQTYAGIPVSGG